MPPFNPRSHRMTVFDIMEAQGKFASNPANAGAIADDGSPLYRGPVEYPKMFYHPEGLQEVLVPASEDIRGGMIIKIPAQMGLIHRLAQTPEEEEALRSAGWWDHPADAEAAAGRGMPLKSSDQRIQSLEAELARLRKMVPAEAKPAPSLEDLEA